MRVRDALERDAGALSSLTQTPQEVMREVIHTRTIRVAERPMPSDGGDSDSADTAREDSEEGEPEGEDSEDGETEGEVSNRGGSSREDSENDESDEGGFGRAGDEPTIIGFVGFDAEREAVHVTHLAGDEAAFDSLLAEPVRFARKVELPVQMLVPESEDALRTAVEEFGFEDSGFGPQFEGTPTRKYRLD